MRQHRFVDGIAVHVSQSNVVVIPSVPSYRSLGRLAGSYVIISSLYFSAMGPPSLVRLRRSVQGRMTQTPANIFFIPPVSIFPTRFLQHFHRAGTMSSSTWVDRRILPLMNIDVPLAAPAEVVWTGSQWYNASQLDADPSRFDKNTIEREKIPLGLFSSVIDGPEDALELQARMKRFPDRLSSPYWVPTRLIKMLQKDLPRVVLLDTADFYTALDGLQLVNAAQTSDPLKVKRWCCRRPVPRCAGWDGLRFVTNQTAAVGIYEAIQTMAPLPAHPLPAGILLLVPLDALPVDAQAKSSPVRLPASGSKSSSLWDMLSISNPDVASRFLSYKPKYLGEARSCLDLFGTSRAFHHANRVLSLHALKSQCVSESWMTSAAARARHLEVLGSADVGNTSLANVIAGSTSNGQKTSQLLLIPSNQVAVRLLPMTTTKGELWESRTWVEQRVLRLMHIPNPPAPPSQCPGSRRKWYNLSQITDKTSAMLLDEFTIERECIPLGLFGNVIDNFDVAVELQKRMMKARSTMSSPYWVPLRLLCILRRGVRFSGPTSDVFVDSNGLELVNIAQTTNPALLQYLCRGALRHPRLISFGSDIQLECPVEAIELFEAVAHGTSGVSITSQMVLVPPEALPSTVAGRGCNVVLRGRSWVLLNENMAWKMIVYKPRILGGAKNHSELFADSITYRAARATLSLAALGTSFASPCWMLESEATAEGRATTGSVAIGHCTFVNVGHVAVTLLPSVDVSSELRRLLEVAGCTSPFWIADCIVPLLRLVPERAGVEHGRRTWYNAEHFAESERHRFRDDMATTEQIPLTWRGLPFSAKSGLALQQVMWDRGLREPYWLPLAGMERVFGMSPLPRAKVERVGDMDLVHVSETTNPGSFDVRRTGRHALMLTTMTTNHVLKMQEHARFLEFSQTRADDSTACRWIDEDVLHCTRAGGVRDGQPSVSSPPSRTFAWRNKRWFNAHDFMTEPLAQILKYVPRFVAGCVAPPAEFHIQLAVQAWRTGSCSSLWTTDDLYQDDGSLLVVSSVLIDDVVWLNVMHLGKRNRIMLPKIDDSSSRSGSVT